MAKQQVEADITASPSAETNAAENQPQEEKKAGSGVGILNILQEKGLITEDQIKAAATHPTRTGTRSRGANSPPAPPTAKGSGSASATSRTTTAPTIPNSRSESHARPFAP